MFKGHNFSELSDDVFQTMRSNAIFEQRIKHPEIIFEGDKGSLYVVPTDRYDAVAAPLENIYELESHDKVIGSALEHVRQAMRRKQALTPTQINEISEVYKQFGLEIPKELFMSPAEDGIRQMRSIIKDLPRGSAITEANTSTDSELMKWVILHRMHGTSPGK